MQRKYFFLKNNTVNGTKPLFVDYIKNSNTYYVKDVVSDYTVIQKIYKDNSAGFKHFLRDIKSYSDFGSLLLTGEVFSNSKLECGDTCLTNVNTRLTNSIALEFHNYFIPDITKEQYQFKSAIDFVIKSLPDEFRDVSCIAIAKPEFGFNVDSIDTRGYSLFNGTLVFWLADNITSELLYKYLMNLNFNSEYGYNKNVRISECKNEVDYCIYPSTAYPNHSIKLGYPEINKLALNPFSSTNSRIQLVEKNNLFLRLNVTLIEEVTKNFKLDDEINKVLTKNIQDTLPDELEVVEVDDFTILKDKQSFLAKILGRNADLFANSKKLRVYKNPKSFKLKYVTDVGDFSLFSCGVSTRARYFCYRYDPYYLFPIDKGCAFIFEQVDRETYTVHLYNRLINDKLRIPSFLNILSDENNSFNSDCTNRLLDTIQKNSSKDVFEPVSYICSTSGGIVLGLQSIIHKKFVIIERISEGKYRSIPNWYRQMRRYLSKDSGNAFLLRFNTVFNPKYKSGIDYERAICNLFYPTPFMLIKYYKNGKKCRLHSCELDSILSQKCPKIKHLVYSATGGEYEAKVFTCWLAKIMQEKKKTKLAWLLQGVQGTGKGLLADLVLRTLLGDYFIKCGISMFDDKFDAWKDQSLLIFVDEYSKYAHDKKYLASSRIKELITEDKISSRQMFSSYKEVSSYSNYMFASNISDAIHIESSDRRFNIGNWQGVKFTDSYEAIFAERFSYAAYTKIIAKEIESYARILNSLEYSGLLDKPFLNDAKVKISNLSETAEQSFIRLLSTGDFLGMSIIFDFEDDRSYYPPAHIAYATWILCIQQMYIDGKYTIKSREEKDMLTFILPAFKFELSAMYSAFIGKKCSFKKAFNLIQSIYPVSKRCSRYFCQHTERRQGYLITFYVNIQELMNLVKDNIAINNKLSELKKSYEFSD
jgi:hypothetical protein